MSDTITKDMTFKEALMIKPGAGGIMAEYGLHCIGCHMSALETIEQGSKGHGLSDEAIDEMIEKINQLEVRI